MKATPWIDAWVLAMKRAGYSGQELARRLGVCTAAVSFRYLRAQGQAPFSDRSLHVRPLVVPRGKCPRCYKLAQAAASLRVGIREADRRPFRWDRDSKAYAQLRRLLRAGERR